MSFLTHVLETRTNHAQCALMKSLKKQNLKNAGGSVVEAIEAERLDVSNVLMDVALRFQKQHVFRSALWAARNCSQPTWVKNHPSAIAATSAQFIALLVPRWRSR